MYYVKNEEGKPAIVSDDLEMLKKIIKCNAKYTEAEILEDPSLTVSEMTQD